MKVLLIASASMLAYVYFGYCYVLGILSRLCRTKAVYGPFSRPSITVLITAYNEAKRIRSRIENVLECEYERGLVQVLVASDGSTDGTDEIVESFRLPNVCLFRPTQRLGKSHTQNQAIAFAWGDIVVYSDANTRFSRSFLLEISRPFQSSNVGGVDGHLVFESNPDSGEISRGQSAYWAQELLIRQRESALGILAVASGACLAVRKSLIACLPLNVGEDCAIPLQIVSQGLKLVHSSTAVAFDEISSDSKSEFRNRVRMTLRNWQGTFLFGHLLNPLRSPGYAFALWSHKILRWLSPIFLSLWIFASAATILAHHQLWLLALPAMIFTILSFLVYWRSSFRQVRGFRIVWAFLLTNAGFAVGLWKVVTGQTIAIYR